MKDGDSQSHVPSAQVMGTGVPIAFHGSGYSQPETGVYAGELSWLLYQPSMLSTRATLNVKVGGGNVAMAPVGVYVGNWSTAICRLANVAGGHGSFSVAVGAIVPAPAPPVCHGVKLPPKVGPTAS